MKVSLLAALGTADIIRVGGYDAEKIEFAGRVAVLDLSDDSVVAFEDQQVEIQLGGWVQAVERLDDDAEPDEERRTLDIELLVNVPLTVEHIS